MTLYRIEEKKYLLRRIARIKPYDSNSKKILKSMSLKQLREIVNIITAIDDWDAKPECKQCKKLNAAMRMYEGFRWRFQEDNFLPWQLGFDKDTETILVPEEMLLHFIQLANPGQPEHRIRLTNYPRK